MRLRWKILAVVIALALLGIVGSYVLPSSRLFTTTYNGQTLEAWAWVWSLDLNPKSNREAQAAIRVLTSNNLPEVVGWLNYDPTDRDTPRRYFARMIGSGNEFKGRITYLLTRNPVVSDPSTSRSDAARTALEALGPEAAAVLPQLEILSQSTNDHVSQVAFSVLPHLGTNALPVLLRAMDDDANPRRAEAIKAFGILAGPERTNVGAASPVLLHCLQSKDRKVVYEAIQAIALLEMEPDQAVPALVACLSRPEPEVRAKAASVLGPFAGSASAAAPDLRRLLKDPAIGVRREATNALFLIEPRGLASRPL